MTRPAEAKTAFITGDWTEIAPGVRVRGRDMPNEEDCAERLPLEVRVTPAAPADTVPVPPEAVTAEQAAEIAQRLPCDCDWSAQVEGCPHREWCTRMTPLGVIRDIAGLAAPHFAAAERERIRQLAQAEAAKYTNMDPFVAGALERFADLIGGQP